MRIQRTRQRRAPLMLDVEGHMKKQPTCPRCGRELIIAFRPTNRICERIGLDDGMYCNRCNARVRASIKNSYLVLVSFIPYIALLSWNIFVAQYGMEHYGLKKIDQFWLFISMCILIVGLVIQTRTKVYVLHKNISNKEN